MAYVALIIFVIAFWAAVTSYPKFISLRVGGSFAYGRAFASTISIILVWCGIGTLLNLVYPWLGTYFVVALHLAILVAAVTIRWVLRHRRI